MKIQINDEDNKVVKKEVNYHLIIISLSYSLICVDIGKK